MGIHDFGGAGGAFLFAVFPLSLSSPCHKPRLKNISNKVESVRDCSQFYFGGKSVDYMALREKKFHLMEMKVHLREKKVHLR